MQVWGATRSLDRHRRKFTFMAAVLCFSAISGPLYACLGDTPLTKEQLYQADIVVVADVVAYKSVQESNSASVILRPTRYLKGQHNNDLVRAKWTNISGVPDEWKDPKVIVALHSALSGNKVSVVE